MGLQVDHLEKVAEASERFRAAREILEDCHARFPAAGEVTSQLAWVLVIRPTTAGENSYRAIELARLALRREPWHALRLRVLGAAQYRAGQWSQSVATLERACQLKQTSDGFDWFLRALAYGRLGRRHEAQQCYNEGIRWMDQSACERTQLIPLQSEAEAAAAVYQDGRRSRVPLGALRLSENCRDPTLHTKDVALLKRPTSASSCEPTASVATPIMVAIGGGKMPKGIDSPMGIQDTSIFQRL